MQRVCHRVGGEGTHEDPLPFDDGEQPPCTQHPHGFTDGCPADSKLRTELLFGGELRPGGQFPGRDGILNLHRNLLAQRLAHSNRGENDVFSP